MVDYRRAVEPNIRYKMERTIDNPFVPNKRGGVDYNIDALCKDERVANAISAASFATYERLKAYRPILAAYESFLPRIANELHTRWDVESSEPIAE